MPTLLSIYNSMNKTQKADFRRSFIATFESSGQTFDRRRKKDFKNLIPAEKQWAADYLNIEYEELFQEEAVQAN